MLYDSLAQYYNAIILTQGNIMARTNKTMYSILGFLSLSPMSGYDIMTTIEKTTSHFWAESEGQIYPTLAKLLKTNLVTCEEESIGDRPRKIYTITKKGMQELKNWLVKTPEKRIVRDEFLLKLFFCHNIPTTDVVSHFETRIQRAKEKLKICQEFEKDTKENRTRAPYFQNWLMIAENAKLSVQSEIDWCEKAVRTFKKQRKK